MAWGPSSSNGWSWYNILSCRVTSIHLQHCTKMFYPGQQQWHGAHHLLMAVAGTTSSAAG
eukprot:1157936-Pelagomonas_calceolata.AAC.12